LQNQCGLAQLGNTRQNVREKTGVFHALRRFSLSALIRSVLPRSLHFTTAAKHLDARFRKNIGSSVGFFPQKAKDRGGFPNVYSWSPKKRAVHRALTVLTKSHSLHRHQNLKTDFQITPKHQTKKHTHTQNQKQI